MDQLIIFFVTEVKTNQIFKGSTISWEKIDL